MLLPPPPSKPTYAPPKPAYNPPKKPAYKPPPPPAPKKQPTYAPPKPAYNPPKKPAYKQPPPPKPAYNPPKKPAYKPPPPPTKPAYKPPAPKKQTYQQNKNAPVYVPAPKSFHKPPIIIYQGVAPPVHVYEKSTGGYGPVAQKRSDSTSENNNNNNGKIDFDASESKKVIQTKVAPSKTNTKSEKSSVVEKLPVAQARSAQIQTSSAVVGASVSVESSDTKKEVLTRRGTVEDIDPKE